MPRNTTPSKELSYEEAVNLIKKHFKSYKGEFKTWAKDHDIYYKTLSSILNDNLPNSVPGVVCKILEAIGYSAEVEKRVVFKIKKKT